MSKQKSIQEGLFGNIAQTLSRTAQRASSKPATSKTNIGARLTAFLDPNKALYGLSERDRLAARKFIDNFTSRGLSTLEVAVKNNLVNPNSNVYRLTPKTPKSTVAAPAPVAQGNSPSPIIIPTTYNKKTTSESTYNKLNQIFESYIAELDRLESLPEQTASKGLPSISQYFYDNFIQPYLSGIQFKPMEPKITEILKNLPNLYKTGQLKKELEQLALIAWTLATRSIK